MRVKWTGLLALTLVAGTWACTDDPSGPTGGFPALDAALLAAQEAQGDVEAMREPGVPGMAFPRLRLPSLDGERPDCPEDGHRFRCPPGDQDGISVAHTVTFLDSEGNPQGGLDDATTAQVLFDMSMSGEGLPPFGRPAHGFRGEGSRIFPVSATVERERNLVASGLAGDNASVVWNGTSSSASTHTFEVDGSQWSRTVTSSSVIDNVVLPYPRTEDAWPLSGSVTGHIVFTGGGPDGIGSGEVDSVTTFDGTQFAAVTVNGETMTIDLKERGRRGFGGHGQRK